MQMTPPLWQKVGKKKRKTKDLLDEIEREECKNRLKSQHLKN